MSAPAPAVLVPNLGWYADGLVVPALAYALSGGARGLMLRRVATTAAALAEHMGTAHLRVVARQVDDALGEQVDPYTGAERAALVDLRAAVRDALRDRRDVVDG